MDLPTTIAEITRLRDSGDHAAAAEIAARAAAMHPREWDSLMWLRACAEGAAGDDAAALATLREVEDRGAWFPPDWLMDSDDLARPSGREEFERLIRVFSERRRAATDASAPALMIARGRSTARRALLVLHGNAENASTALPRWAGTTGSGTLLAVAQSGTPVGPDRYAWAAATTGEVRAHAAWLAPATAGVPLVLGGFARGAYHALRLAVCDLVPAAGVIAVGPAMNDLDELIAYFPDAGRRGLRVWFDAGERDDRAVRAANKVGGQLREAGVAVHVAFHAGAREFPAGFDVEARLEFALG